MTTNFRIARFFRTRSLISAGLVLATFLVFPIFTNAQSAQTQKAADARWDSFLSKFSTAVVNKDRRQFIALTSKDFEDGGGSTIQQWLGSEPNSWASLRRSVRSGTKRYRGDPGDVMKITRDNSLIFEYKRGRWLFYGPLRD